MAKYEKHNSLVRATVKDALLELLTTKPFTRISVSELAHAAGISRSTFYAHFPHTRAVFDEALRDFHLEDVMPLHAHLRCEGCTPAPSACASDKRPFCEAVRGAGKYQPLVNDPAYFPAVMDLLLTGEGKQGILDDYRKMGLTEQQAHAVAVFQLSGCYAAATNCASAADWAETQRIIDVFVRGGVQALRSR